MKPNLELAQRYVRGVLVVEDSKREAKLGPERVQRDSGFARLLQNVVGRFPNRGQVIHEGPGPVKNNIPQHGSLSFVWLNRASVGYPATAATQTPFSGRSTLCPSAR